MISVLPLFLLASAPLPADQAELPARTQEHKEIVVVGRKPNDLWLEGLEAFKAGRYAEAEATLYVLEQRVETFARFDAITIGSFTSDFIFTVDRVPDGAAAIVYVRGIAQARQGKLDAAAGAMKEAMRVDSKFFDAYVDLALIEALRGRPDRARRQLKFMAKLLAKCDYNCEEKQARYERVKEVAYADAKPQQ